jgi:hypothetical protein
VYKILWWRKHRSKDFDWCTRFEPPWIGRNGFRNAISLHVWVCSSLAVEWLDGFYSYSIFKSVSVIGRCQMNMNIQAPKVGVFQMVPETQNGDIIEDGLLVNSKGEYSVEVLRSVCGFLSNTWRYIPEDRTLHSHRVENLESSAVNINFVCSLLHLMALTVK